MLSMEQVTVAIRADDATLSYPLGNHQGSIVATVPTGTGAVSRHLYDPYGAPRTPGPSVTDRGFLSQPYETSAGMSYLHHRFYEPATGVFTTVDPLVASTGTPYLYANGNPTTLSDPNGLDPDTNAATRMQAAANGQCTYSKTVSWGSACGPNGVYYGRVTKVGPRPRNQPRVTMMTPPCPSLGPSATTCSAEVDVPVAPTGLSVSLCKRA
jgi:RHS repeat-associated protein